MENERNAAIRNEAGIGHHRLESLVDRLCGEKQCNLNIRRARNKPLPSADAMIDIVKRLRSVFFPGCFGPEEVESISLKFHLGAALDYVYHSLKEQVHRGMCFLCEDSKEACLDCAGKAERAADEFIERVPEISRLLNTDVEATYLGDPAANHRSEVIFCYPGITATLAYRIAHELYKLRAPIISRIMTEWAHGVTGIDIHPGAEIGEGFMIDHGTGVVIGETCVIGQNVRLYQSVTLGAKSFPLDEHGNPVKGVKRHPMLGDNVIVYSGATILGPVEIGANAVIGGNVWLTEGVPPGTRVLQSRYSQETYAGGSGI